MAQETQFKFSIKTTVTCVASGESESCDVPVTITALSRDEATAALGRTLEELFKAGKLTPAP